MPPQKLITATYSMLALPLPRHPCAWLAVAGTQPPDTAHGHSSWTQPPDTAHGHSPWVSVLPPGPCRGAGAPGLDGPSVRASSRLSPCAGVSAGARGWGLSPGPTGGWGRGWGLPLPRHEHMGCGDACRGAHEGSSEAAFGQPGSLTHFSLKLC